VEIASRTVYPIDLGLAVADTQGGMGYMIAQTLQNELHRRRVDRACATLVTCVLVDQDDPAFDHPTKPIGPFMEESAAKEHQAKDGWSIIEDAGRGFRRVVPSPVPLRIIEADVLRELVQAGHLLVAGGGGGIPVMENADGELHGVEAVIDKDLTSALLAADVNADVLAIITGVECVYVNYGQPNQSPLRRADAKQLAAYIAQDQFAEGSMLPKIRAAVDFLRRTRQPGARVIITDWSDLPAALEGRAGTTIVLDDHAAARSPTLLSV
jgi:carbamate kinase